MKRIALCLCAISPLLFSSCSDKQGNLDKLTPQKQEQRINTYLFEYQPDLKVKRDSLVDAMKMLQQNIADLTQESASYQSREAKRLIKDRLTTLKAELASRRADLKRFDEQIEVLMAKNALNKSEDGSLLAEEIASARSLADEMLADVSPSDHAGESGSTLTSTSLEPKPDPEHKTPPASNLPTENTERSARKQKLDSLTFQLQTIQTNIDNERKRWKSAIGTINRLTLNKTRPVVQGSRQYYQCLAASKIVQEVERKAPALKQKKATILEAIKQLEAQ